MGFSLSSLFLISRKSKPDRLKPVLPIRQPFFPAQDLGGPAAQIHRLRNAVSAVASEHHSVRAAWMLRKNRPPLVGDQDGPTPPIREAHVLQRWMEGTNAGFKPRDEFRRLARPDLHADQLAPILEVDQAASENDAARAHYSSPQIWKIDGVERLFRREAQAFQLASSERLRRNSKREFCLPSACEPAQFER